MRDFELYGTVDAVICMLDSINYITTIRSGSCFQLVHMYLNRRLFIFDINSEYKLSHILGRISLQLDDDISWIWNNTYNPSDKLCTFELTFFRKTHGGLYMRFDETHVERAYSDEEIRAALCRAGIKLLGRFGGLSFTSPGPEEERIFYITKKEPPCRRG